MLILSHYLCLQMTEKVAHSSNKYLIMCNCLHVHFLRLIYFINIIHLVKSFIAHIYSSFQYRPVLSVVYTVKGSAIQIILKI